MRILLLVLASLSLTGCYSTMTVRSPAVAQVSYQVTARKPQYRQQYTNPVQKRDTTSSTRQPISLSRTVHHPVNTKRSSRLNHSRNLNVLELAKRYQYTRVLADERISHIRISGSDNELWIERGAHINKIEISGSNNRIYLPRSNPVRIVDSGRNNRYIER